MSNRIENISNFIDVSLDELANADIKFIKGIKAIFRVAGSGKNIIDGENNNDFNKFKESLKRELKELSKSPKTDENHLREILDNMKLFFNDEESLINYYKNKEELVKKIRYNTNIPPESELPSTFADIIISNIKNLVTFEDWSKAIYDMLTKLSRESLEKLENLYALNYDIKKTVVQGFVDTQQSINDIRQDIRNISPIPQTSPQSQTSIKDDSGSYLKDFNRRLFLDTDYPEINLKSMYVSPRIAENESQFAAEAIMKWYNDWDDYSPTTMFVFGDAGVGKSSLCAKMVYDSKNISTNEKKDFSIPNEKLHICRLRSHIKRIEKNNQLYSIKDLIALLFKIHTEEYEFNDDIFVLDGFDEFCVLTQNYYLIEFILDKLNGFSTSDFKILITSRKSEQYFSNYSIERSGNIRTLNLNWSPSSVEQWCQKYAQLSQSEDIKKWCRAFPEKYKNFPDDDKRREIFCIPIILYISANTKIDVAEHSSVGEIYDKAFREIAHRKHGAKQDGMDVFNKNEEIRQRLINWQFTKEVAYQMCLHDTLSISNTRKSSLLDNAKKRTVVLLKEKHNIIINTEDIEIPQYLALFHFARPSDEGLGIEFAHKTVYEYFTAVKLYEDYFAEITENYIRKFRRENVSPLENVWINIIEAFRYKSIDDNIFTYLNKMVRPVYNGRADDAGENFDFKTFELLFLEGMEKHILSELQIKNAVKEYKVKSILFFDNYEEIVQYPLLTTQINYAFCNLTWFLTERDNAFNNKDDNKACKRFIKLLSVYSARMNMKRWKLNDADLSDINLTNANLSNADLREANLSHANMYNAELSNANMSNANLSEANLSHANMYNADLSNTNLRNAYLSDADLSNTNLRNAYLSDADLSNANLSDADLSNANLSDTKIKKATLIRTKLTRADLSNANLSNANLINADLSNTKLNDADLSDANLNDAKMKQATLKRTKLIHADLSNANLSNANLGNADLRGAYLGHSNLSEAIINGTIMNEARMSEAILFSADLSCTQMINANLRKADLREAILFGAKLNNANLNQADLREADLRGADLSGARLTGASLRGSKYCLDGIYKTIFPTDFNPKEHDMVEIDVYDNQVKKTKSENTLENN